MRKLKVSKRNRSIAIGLACGLLSAVCVGVYVVHMDEQAAATQAEMLAKYGGEQVDVCVAKRDIPAGETIVDSDIETRTWIATLLPVDAVTERRDAVGKQVGSTILAGEVVSSARFGFESAQIDVPDGMVAISVPTREVQSVGGAVEPGMGVDVYAVGANSTTLAAPSVQVLATSSATDGGSSAGSNAWVTLAVKPQNVQELVAAAETMQIYLTMPSSQLLAFSEEQSPHEEEQYSNRAGHDESDSSTDASQAGR